jgi:hypothetical protein
VRPALAPLAILAVSGALLAGCGSSDEPREPVEQVDTTAQEQVRAAQAVKASDFPAPEGKTLRELANAIGGGPEMGLASSVFTSGEDPNRLAFGVIDQQGQFVYGQTAVYVARRQDARARGPYPAPADVLVTEPRFRSRQAATEGDPFAAVYAAQVPFDRPGRWSVLAVTHSGDGRLAAPAQVEVVRPGADRIPAVGERAPPVETDTLASVGGREEILDTREPPDDMHARSFADVVGKRPVALLFATPQLCQSRVCGPVTDVLLQLKRSYGDRMEFIHQEVYVDNQPQKGVREPLRRFALPTEPWLFVVDRDGRVTARLEGSFGFDAVKRALDSGL